MCFTRRFYEKIMQLPVCFTCMGIIRYCVSRNKEMAEEKAKKSDLVQTKIAPFGIIV